MGLVQDFTKRLLKYPSYVRWQSLPPLQVEEALENEQPERLAQLAHYCARSYRWTRRTFEKEMAKEGITSTAIFRRFAGQQFCSVLCLV